jgi:predicted DNA repair protein MutK
MLITDIIELGSPMAGTNLLTLLDDITSLLDDIATMSKVATKKTAGVLGDDLALNAQQVTGVAAERELPVVWAVAKGSFLNKGILVPAALLISVWLPWLITPLLIVGGLFLCFEGAEKVFARWLPHDEKIIDNDEQLDLVEYEKQKIKGAIRTDFILSAEIIVITLGTVAGATLINQALVLCVIAIIMTMGVYGLVAGIVKLDDAGLYLLNQSKVSANKFKELLGKGLLAAAPRLMQFLAFSGTIAMFLVGGGILVHGIGLLRHAQINVTRFVQSIAGNTAEILAPLIFDGLAGLLAGLLLVLVYVAYTQSFNK